jgi:LacI family transcriptional regulator
LINEKESRTLVESVLFFLRKICYTLGKRGEKQMKLTIKQIAEMAGVSVTTVSQILNNKGSRFSEETRKRVLDIVNKYHYKPDFFASNLINRHSKTIGMIVPDVTDF